MIYCFKSSSDWFLSCFYGVTVAIITFLSQCLSTSFFWGSSLQATPGMTIREVSPLLLLRDFAKQSLCLARMTAYSYDDHDDDDDAFRSHFSAWRKLVPKQIQFAICYVCVVSCMCVCCKDAKLLSFWIIQISTNLSSWPLPETQLQRFWRFWILAVLRPFPF